MASVVFVRSRSGLLQLVLPSCRPTIPNDSRIELSESEKGENKGRERKWLLGVWGGRGEGAGWRGSEVQESCSEGEKVL